MKFRDSSLGFSLEGLGEVGVVCRFVCLFFGSGGADEVPRPETKLDQK